MCERGLVIGRLPEQGRKRLDCESYSRLRQEVLRRDRWRCQCCGRTEDLQVHHIEPRGHLGDDAEQNLITLCAECHGRLHRIRCKPIV